MPLNNGSINQIMPFAAEGIVESGDLEPLASYLAHQLRLRGHQPGIANRAIENRALRQALHMAAGVAQFIANRHAPGVNDDGDLDAVEAGLVAAVNEAVAAAIPEIPEGLTAAAVQAMITAAIQKIDLTPYATITALNNGLAQCVKQGWHTIFLPALSFFDAHSKRQPELTEAGAWSSWSRMYGLTFSPTTIQGAQAEFIFPASWDRGLTHVDLLWSPQAAWGGAVRWNFYSAHAAATHPTAADGVRHKIGWSNGVVGSVHAASFLDIDWGTTVPGDICRAFAYRVANADDDTLACVAHLLGVIIYYTTNKGDDS